MTYHPKIGFHIGKYQDEKKYPNKFDTYFDERSKAMVNSTPLFNSGDKEKLIEEKYAFGVLFPTLECEDKSKNVYGSSNKCPDNQLKLGEPKEIKLYFENKPLENLNKWETSGNNWSNGSGNYCGTNIINCYDKDICDFMISKNNE